MRKHGFAMLALAAMMTFGTVGISAMAAEGWVQENSNWVYYNSAGSRLNNAWKQGADGYWRYLDGTGKMALNSWVDNDSYYVDTNGIMIASKWLKVANTNSDNSGYDWYYFSTTGKAIKEKWEKIDNKWYYFNDTGAMLSGWILDDMYYSGTDGAMLTGWQKLVPPDGVEEEYKNSPMEDEQSDGMRWYYFMASNGKKVLPDDNGENVKQKKIDGVYYCLDETGAMQTGWTCVTGDDSENIEDYRYIDANGKMRIGWYSIEPPENMQGQYENDVEWFYFNNKGIPKIGSDKGSARSSDLSKINGNTYLFNEKGVPAYGLQKIYVDGADENYTAYFFGTRVQSSMLTGKQRVEEGGVTAQYYFTNTGRGYTGVHDSCLYYMGKLQTADSGSRYEAISVPSGNDYKNYVVNTNGRIAKSTTVKDSNGVKYKTNSGGILIREDDEEVDGSVYRSPEEPDWDSDNY